MCSQGDHERIGPMLASFERASRLKQIDHEDAAEKAREGGKDDEAEHHEERAAVHKRRAEMAEAGYLLHSKDEATDAEHMRGHAELFNVAHRTGRVRFEHD